MPIYEFLCQACQERFELMRPMSQASEKGACPKCAQLVPRAISRFACLAKDDAGYTAPLGGSACGSCTSSSCGTCGS